MNKVVFCKCGEWLAEVNEEACFDGDITCNCGRITEMGEVEEEEEVSSNDLLTNWLGVCDQICAGVEARAELAEMFDTEESEEEEENAIHKD